MNKRGKVCERSEKERKRNRKISEEKQRSLTDDVIFCA